MGTEKPRSALDKLGAPTSADVQWHGQRPLTAALLAQLLGTLAAFVVALAFAPAWFEGPLAFACLQGGMATVAAWLLRAPVWWLPIHLGFTPLAVVARGMELPSWVWAGGFLLLLLVFWRTDLSRVPLYFTNRRTRDALLALLPSGPCRVIDLGCGDGAVLRHLARVRPDCRFVGIEHAPLPWAWARLAARGQANLDIRRGDFWGQSLAGYALVYAFLSPAAMPRLWVKARTEMSPGACLVSNSFAVPEREARVIVDVTHGRRTRLHVYQLARP